MACRLAICEDGRALPTELYVLLSLCLTLPQSAPLSTARRQLMSNRNARLLKSKQGKEVHCVVVDMPQLEIAGVRFTRRVVQAEGRQRVMTHLSRSGSWRGSVSR